MSANFSLDDPTIISRNLLNLEDADKPLIKVLLYTDDPKEVVRTTGKPLGLGSMISHLESHRLAFADLCITLKSRYPNGTATPVSRLNLLLEEEEKTGKPFDQIWVFGLHQINKQNFKLGINGGGPNSELDEDEVSALRSRMDTGLGVLVTGDHANRRPADALDTPDSPCDDDARKQRFLGLGRALGRCIPRAGQLRDWEGGPTADARHSLNTQVVTAGVNIDTETQFQADPIGQQLILQRFNDRGKPSRQGHSHALFLYRDGGAIQLFPDHLHEGAATLPTQLNGEWVSVNGIQPKPEVVAFGLDKRNGRKFMLMVAYDGDVVGSGRIVADSTWHHYFNANLTAFPVQSNPGTAADQIGQFYANLALWLTPRSKRNLMADCMSRWLKQHPEIAELAGPVPSQNTDAISNTGALAKGLLAQVASDCEIHELLQMVTPDSYKQKHESLYFPEERFTLSPLPSKQLLLGSLMHAAPDESPEILANALFSDVRLSFRRNAVTSASEMAFKKQRRKVAATARLARKLFPNTG